MQMPRNSPTEQQNEGDPPPRSSCSVPTIILALPAAVITLMAYSQILNPSQSVPSFIANGSNQKSLQPAKSEAPYARPYPMDGLSTSWGYLWDDGKNYVENPHIYTGLRWSNIDWAVRPKTGTVLGVYEPVANVIKMGIHSMVHYVQKIDESDDSATEEGAKGALSPRMYRVVSLILHVINVILLLFVTRPFVDDAIIGPCVSICSDPKLQKWISILTTAGLVLGTCLYAVHPLNVQVVAWPSCLPYELSAIFCLLSFWAYVLDKRKAGTMMFKVVSVACYVAATFCKAPAVVLPAVFLVVDVYAYGGGLDDNDMEQVRSLAWHDVFLPHLIIRRFTSHTVPQLAKRTIQSLRTALALHFLAAIFVTFGLISTTEAAVEEADRLNILERIIKSIMALGWYVRKIIVPVDLVALVEVDSFYPPSAVSWLWTVLGLIAVPYGTVVILVDSIDTPTRRAVACTYGAMLGLLFPSLGLVQHAQKMMLAADRYAYLPLLVMGPALAAIVAGLCATIYHEPTRSPCTKNYARSKKGKEVRTKTADTSTSIPRAFLFILAVTLVAMGIGIFTTRLVPIELYHWRNSQLLWTRNVNLAASCGICHSNLLKEYLHYSLDLRKAEIHALAAVDALRGTTYEYKSRLSLARIYFRQNRIKEAMTILDDLSSKKTSIQNLRRKHYFHAHVFLKTGKLDEARTHMALAAGYGDRQAKLKLPLLEQDIALLQEARAAAINRKNAASDERNRKESGKDANKASDKLKVAATERQSTGIDVRKGERADPAGSEL